MMNLGFDLGVPSTDGIDLRFYNVTIKLGEQAERTH